MARTSTRLGGSSSLSDYINAGVLVRCLPRSAVDEALIKHGRQSIRERAMPAYLVVYFVVALGLYMGVAYEEVLRSFLEGWRWLRRESGPLKVASKGAISQARERLGYEVMADLAARCLQPLASSSTLGAYFAGRRLVSLDGSTLELADEVGNARDFGYPGRSRGEAAFPQLRFVGLLETGTHAWLAAEIDSYATSEITLAKRLTSRLRDDQLCLADRGFVGYPLFHAVQATGAAILWRARSTHAFPVLERYPDGSYRSLFRADRAARQESQPDLPVRVIAFQLMTNDGVSHPYKLITTLTPAEASAGELAALYRERWEIETSLDELKTHLKGPRVAMRSKTPDLVKQEFYGLILAHYAIRRLMFEAAQSAAVDSDRLSFTQATRSLRRRLPHSGALPPRAA